MLILNLIGKMLTGERDGSTIWEVLLGDISYDPITDPSEGVLVASLAENILRFGLLQPIIIRKNQKGGKKREKYVLVAGRRRLEALRMLGRTHAPAIVVACDEKRAPVLSVSENLLRRSPNYAELAVRLSDLVSNGWEVERLAGALAMPKTELNDLLTLARLSPAELQRMRRMDVSREDAVRLQSFAPAVKAAILDKRAADPDVDLSALITEMRESPDLRLTQTHKILVNDVRVFLNTIEKSAATMKSAGFDTKVEREELADCYVFEVRVSKSQGVMLRDERKKPDVSRETSAINGRAPGFSAATSIFKALAEEETSIGADVSRETCAEKGMISFENAENLELCIDGRRKK